MKTSRFDPSTALSKDPARNYAPETKVTAAIDGGYSDVSKDDANYPLACLCPKSGCSERAFCTFFHFGQQGWTR